MSSAARLTRSRVWLLAPGAARITIETRARETPARAATSSNVGRRFTHYSLERSSVVIDEFPREALPY